MKTLLKVLGILFAALFGLFALSLAALYFLVDLDKIINDRVAAAKPKIEDELGRTVTVGPISTTILPTLGARVEQIAIGPDTTKKEDDRPLMQIGAVGFRMNLWKAIATFGQTITVESVYIEGLKVNLIQYEGGALSIDDIRARQAAKPKEEEKASGGIPAEVMEYIRNTSIDDIHLADGEFRLVDYNTPTRQPAEAFVKKFNLRLNDVRLSDAIKIKIDAAIFSDATNFDFYISLGPLPQDLNVTGLPPINALKIKLTDVDISRIAPYLGPAVPVKIASALVSADYSFDKLDLSKPLDLKGFVAVKKLQVAGGQAFDLRIDTDLTADLNAFGADLRKVEVAIGGVKLEMAGKLATLTTAPQFENFTLKTTTLDPALLLAYYPPAAANLPKGLKIAGPVSVDVRATGDAKAQTVKANVEATRLDVLLPGTFMKPAGTTLALAVDGDFTAKSANLKSANLKLDEVDLTLSGTVNDFANPQIDITADTNSFSFDRLARLSPMAGDQLKKNNAKAEGDGKLSAKVKGTLSNIDGALDFALTGVKLSVPGTQLAGNLTLKAFAKGNPQQDFDAGLRFDANNATIVVKDTLNKGPTTPMVLDASIAKRGPQIDVKTLALEFAELKLTANGGFNQSSGVTNLNVAFQRLDLEKFARTVTAIPAALVKQSFVDMKIGVRGNPQKLSTLAVDLTGINVKIGRSDLRGNISIKNLEAPDVKLDIQSNYLNVNEAVPGMGQSSSSSSTAQKAPPKDDPSLKKYAFDGRFDLKRIIYDDNDIQNFRGDVLLNAGTVTLREASFMMFDGAFSAKGTSAEVWRGVMPYDVHFNIRGLDLNKALSAKTKYRNVVMGKGDLSVDVKGRGFETTDLERTLTGEIGIGMREGKFATAKVTGGVLDELRVLEKVPGVKIKLPKSEERFQDLRAELHVKNGRLNLKKPVVANLDGNRIELTGAIGIAGALFLDATYYLPGRVVKEATQGKCASDKDLRVPVKIGGSALDPKIKPDAGGLMQNLIQACMKGAVGKEVDKLKDKAVKEAEKQAEKALGKQGKKATDKAKKALKKFGL